MKEKSDPAAAAIGCRDWLVRLIDRGLKDTDQINLSRLIVVQGRKPAGSIRRT
jgi:hypothetical protein